VHFLFNLHASVSNKGPPQGKKADLSSIEPLMYFNHKTGELAMRKKDGTVNNFNSTTLKANRCNMDIKFIGSGGNFVE
jgi:hypothetical protein